MNTIIVLLLIFIFVSLLSPIIIKNFQVAIGKKITQKKTVKIKQNIIFENKNLNLPKEPVGTPIPNFYGRETELDTVKSYFDDANSKNRLLKLQICGIGGIGKTSFIEEFCERYKNLFDETHYWKWPDKYSTKNDLKRQWVYAIVGKITMG